jgi:DNA-binding NarL/FixJ family response regulator
MTEMPELTPVERRILVLVVEGRTNGLIRARLGLGSKALALHLRSLYQKSGIHQPYAPYNLREIRQRLVEWGRYYFSQEGY